MPTRSLGVIVFTFVKFAFGIGIHFKLSTALQGQLQNPSRPYYAKSGPDNDDTWWRCARRPLYRDHLGDFQLNSFSG
jgi:hypothetical protein